MLAWRMWILGPWRGSICYLKLVLGDGDVVRGCGWSGMLAWSAVCVGVVEQLACELRLSRVVTLRTLETGCQTSLGCRG